jgi:hypothetical protein
MDLTGRGLEPKTMKTSIKMDFLMVRRKSVAQGIAVSCVDINPSISGVQGMDPW